MNILKAQQEILKAIIENPQNVRYFSYDIDNIFITANGAVGYIFPAEAVRIRLEGAQLALDWLSEHIEETMQPRNRLVGTDEYRKGGTARKYVRADDSEAASYFDVGLLKNFTNPELYQDARNPLSLAAVVEQGIGQDERKVVGVIMPVKIEATI